MDEKKIKNQFYLKSSKKKEYKSEEYHIKLKNKGRLKYKKFIHEKKSFKIAYFIYFILTNIMNVYSLVLYIFETYAESTQKYKKIKISLYIRVQDLICGIYFLFEYFFILFHGFKYSYIDYFLSFSSFFDIITIIPSFIIFFIDDYIIVSIFKVIKIFRCYRILQTMNIFHILYIKNFDNKFKVDFIYMIIVFTIIFIISGGLLVGLNDLTNNAFNVESLHFFDGLYVFFVTATTLGYGDIYPTNLCSRTLIIILIVIFVSITSKQLSNAIEIFETMKKYKKYKYKEHLIIIINKSINLFDILYDIKIKDLEQIIIILSENIKSLPSDEFPYNDVYLVNSNIIDFELLERLNTKYAKCIFIFSKNDIENEDTEKENEFLLIKIKNFYPKIPIYFQNINSINMYNYNKGNNNTMFKNLHPLSDLKSIIFSTAMNNNGYLTFIQNLIFNHRVSPNLFLNFDILMQVYFFGCDNTIVIEKLPSYFIGNNFYDVMREIYSNSINDYFEKIIIQENINEIKPILLIGIYECDEEFGDKIIFLSNNYKISKNSLGIFISNNRNSYIKKALEIFNDRNSFKKMKTIRKEQNDFIYKAYNSKRRKSFLVSLDNSINEKSEKIIIENEIERKNNEKIKFLERKENMLILGKKFNCQSTKDNLIFLNDFYEPELDEIINKIQVNIKMNNLHSILKSKNKYDINNRIFDSSKKETKSMFSNHILIFGYQDNLNNLIQRIRTFYNKNAICIIINREENKNISKIKEKILKRHENVYLILGDITNPKNLKNCSIKKSIFCLFLVSNINDSINDDIKKILCYRTIERFFNINTIIEIFNSSSLKYLGYSPINPINEFFHPLYFGGNIFLLDHFDRLLPKLYLNEKKIKTWIEFIKLGNIKKLRNNGENSKIHLLSIDIPEIYIGKDYFSLFCDFICLESPITVLGIYINDTEEYQMNKNGYYNNIQNNFSSNGIIFGNHKYKQKMFQEKNLYYIRKMIDRSMNGKSNRECIDINKPFLPIFITNPPPWFKLPKKTEILILCNYEQNHNINSIVEFQKNLIKKVQRKRRKLLSENKRMNIRIRQNKFFDAIFCLKEKMKENYIKEFNDIY